jgi:hypothetical protein
MCVLPITRCRPYQSTLTVCNLLNRAILIDMDIQPLGLVVHGSHGVGLENAVFLGEIGLREGLQDTLSACIPVKLQDGRNGRWRGGRGLKVGVTNHFIMLIPKLLAHELAHPVITAASVLGHQTGDYERHVVEC